TAGETEREQRRDPGRCSQLTSQSAKDAIAIIDADLAIRFDFKQRQEDEPQCGEEKQDRPWSNVQLVQSPPKNSMLWSGFGDRRLRSQPGRDNPMLGRPDDEEEKQTPRLQRDAD